MSGQGTARAKPGSESAAVAAHEFFRRGEANAEGWSMLIGRGRDWERAYRDRWAHDKVVRSTHGVNCTGSCSWNVYVKDGLITWETQAVDYPRTDPGRPDHEPRGCPRGASFSWYTYSPVRLKHPYIRGSLLTAFREALTETPDDPVAAFAKVAQDGTYRRQRGRGGFVRATWEEATELVSAATVHAIKEHGPDRVAGFTPIPAMSPVSFSAGSRFISLIGGAMCTFYDWYADLPPASPQVFGDQTDVPESADWWDAGYLIIWGTNLPITRTPDAHFMTEARYRGQKVVVVSPDYSDHVKFADDWVAAHPGTDGALAMAMGHVMLKETWVERPVARFQEYGKTYTDLPMLVTLEEREDGTRVPGRFLSAADLADPGENADWKTVVLDAATGVPAIPNGSIGFRYGEEGKGHWNLQLGEIDPVLTLHGHIDAQGTAVALPRFDVGDGPGGATMARGVPAIQVGDHLVTTVLDLTLATYGVARDGLPGEWPSGYDDATQPYTPAWQEALTGVPPGQAIKIAREFARNAEVSGGRSMICMGAGTNHWFHSDETYRAFISLLLLCGCVGINGGGWAHYVGQEKIRTFAGWQMVSSGGDWRKPPRNAQGTSWFYTHTEQWRYDRLRPELMASPLGTGLLDGQTALDAHAKAVRMGWMPSFPTFDRNPLVLADEGGEDPVAHVVEELREGRLGFAVDDPSAPSSFPRVFFVWRSNLLGSSGKGQEYFMKHLLGAEHDGPLAEELPPGERPRDVRWRDEAPQGKLDLLVNLDFRMTTTGLYSDVVLPAATWYEKYDLSMTDMHPFVHSFNRAIPPPWEARSDWDAFRTIAERFSQLAATHLGVRRDVVATAIQHDTPGEIAQPRGEVRDWRAGECEPVPGVTMPNLTVVERDYGAVAEQWAALGPLAESQGSTVKSASWKPGPEVEWLAQRNGRVRSGRAAGRPSLARAEDVAEAVLALSAVSNGRLALEGFKTLELRCGVPLASLAEGDEGHRITFQDAQVQPRRVITSPEWSGIDEEGRAYAAFTINVERLKPWHTLSGRMHFYVDHAWMRELGEALPAYRPPIDPRLMLAGGVEVANDGIPEVTLRYLTPHSKWSIHSEYQDNLHMLTLFRGGSGVWMSPQDAAAIGVKDNDWVEAYNRNGVVVSRAVVSHRVPPGVCMVYHSKDRQLSTPRSEIDGRRGGTENALTTIAMKATHMVGGYAQLSFSPNYYGPTGSNRDSVTVVRKHTGKVEY